MALNRIQAKRLLTAKELQLFETSLTDHASALDERELNAALRQVRNHRDKYQDLLRRQRIGSRIRTGSKSGPQANDNARTQSKLDAFAQALGRLEKQQQRRERAQPASRDGARDPRLAAWRSNAEEQPRSAHSPTAQGETSSASASKQATPGVRQAKKLQDSGQQRPLAHVSSRGRRQQARRDSR